MPNSFTLVSYPGFALAWANETPGLVSGGPMPEAATVGIPLALVEFEAWLRAHGEAGLDDHHWEIRETFDGQAIESDGRDPAYPADRAPMAPAEFDRLRRVCMHSQAGLREAANLPAALLDWRPEGLMVEHADPWAPDPRTIRGILTHALQLEVFYREGLQDGPAAGIFHPVGEPEVEHRVTLATLQAIANMGDTGRVFHPVRPHAGGAPSRPPGDWTVRKVFRRLISHNRAHAAEIIQRRTWLLLGVPGGASAIP